MKNLKSFKVFENEQEKKGSSKKEPSKEEVLELAYEWQESGHYDGYSLPELIEMAQEKLGKN
jgi:hypothetical protein